MHRSFFENQFHFESAYCDAVVFKEEEIRKLAQQIRAMIDDYGIDEFCARIKESLEKHTDEYKINGRCCGICDNMNK